MDLATHNPTELSYEDYLANAYRPAFDGMRGIGFLLVITAHIPSVPLFSYLQGWTGVWVFFAISGYLLTMLMMREEKSHGRVLFGPFLVKRFFRIVPSYWAAILIYGLACFSLPPLAGDYAELGRMVPEKLEAFSRAGTAVANDWWTIQISIFNEARHLWRQAMKGRAPTIAEFSVTASRNAEFLLRTFERLGAMTGAGLHPIHATAMDNAKRLKQVTRRNRR